MSNGKTKKRSYDLNDIKSDYEKKLDRQSRTAMSDEDTETSSESTIDSPIDETVINQSSEEDYINPDQEEYKRMSLFMEWDTWERIQALCWNENAPVNKVIVDKLREWSLDVPDETLNKYRLDMKQKHLDKWAQQRDILKHWWQTSGLRDQMNIKSFKVNISSLTAVETTGTVHNYYIHRGWVTDGQNKFAKEKILLAQLKRIK